jgi:ribose/xylose/arabinose/galactoside ABC-type transport system permease subunit
MVISYLKRYTKTLLLLAMAIAVVVVIYAINPGFLARPALKNTLLTMSMSGVGMVGMACLLMSGSIDLSSDGIALLNATIFAYATGWFAKTPWPVMLLFPIVTGVIIALIHSFLTNKLGFMPFIATIGMSSVYSGIVSIVTNAQNVMIMRPNFTKLANMDILLRVGAKDFFAAIPLFFGVMTLIIVAYGLMLSKTNFGRSIYMCGGNRYAARLSGLNPVKISTALYINNAMLASVAGLMWASQKSMASLTYVSASPTMSGMTAAILGGVSFMGGGATGMGGAFVGLLLLNFFTQGLAYIPALASAVWWRTAFGGFILVAALIMDTVTHRRQMRALLRDQQKKLDGGAARAV